jgi:RNA polymerase-associated protein
LVDELISGANPKNAEKARKELRDGLLTVAPIFAEKPFFMSEEFTLVDCCLAPILWRLPQLGVVIPQTRQSKPLFDYMDRLFERPAFQESLTEKERELRSEASVA